jgi:hypothetical protein
VNPSTPVLALAESRPGDRTGLNEVENRSYNKNEEIIIINIGQYHLEKNHTHQ